MENKRIIQVDEKVPVKLLIPLSIQHMFAMFGASVLVPFVLGINPAIVLFMNGLGTLLFILITKGQCAGLSGIRFAFLAPAASLSANGAMLCPGLFRGRRLLRLYSGIDYLQVWFLSGSMWSCLRQQWALLLLLLVWSWQVRQLLMRPEG